MSTRLRSLVFRPGFLLTGIVGGLLMTLGNPAAAAATEEENGLTLAVTSEDRTLDFEASTKLEAPVFDPAAAGAPNPTRVGAMIPVPELSSLHALLGGGALLVGIQRLRRGSRN